MPRRQTEILVTGDRMTEITEIDDKVQPGEDRYIRIDSREVK
jgi:hypothetical protein